MESSSKLALGLLRFGFALSFVLLLHAAMVETPTVDEYAHVPTGLAYWQHGSFSLYSKNPPLLRLWMSAPLLLGNYNVPEVGNEPFGWGPWEYGLQFERENFDRYLAAFPWARVMIVALTMVTGWLVYLWTRRLFGLWPAVVSTAGFLFSPTVLAHGHLATTDMGCTFLVALTSYWLSLVAKKSTALVYTRAGLAFGAALAAKFSAVFLIPWFVLRMWRGLNRRTVLALGASIVTGLLVIWLSYGFQGLFPSWGSFHFVSQRFQALPIPAALNIPLPRDFVAGFDAQMGDAEQGEFGNYLMGEHSRTGWWYYNLVAIVVKESPLTCLLFVAVPFGLIGRRREDWLPVVGPLFFLGVPLVFFNPIQVGVRYLLPIYPFLFILSGGLMARLPWGRLTQARAGVALSGLATVFALGAAPDFISYFDPLVTIGSEKEDWLLDSNLDWGQDLYRLKEFSQKHSEALNHGEASNHGEPLWLLYFGHVSPKHYVSNYQILPPAPVRGWVVVSPNFVRGLGYVTPSEAGFQEVTADYTAWLKDRTPVAHLGALLVYDLNK